MHNKKKLQKVANILEKFLPIIETLEADRPLKATASSIMYETGLNVLVHSTPLNQVINKQKRFQTAKMVRSAKNLTKDFQDFALISYADFFEHTLNRINKLNGASRLAPHKEDILNVIKSSAQDFLLQTDAFYENLMTDIFNVGRQHQEVAGLRKEGILNRKKYLLSSSDQVTKFNKLNNLMQTELTIIMGNLENRLEQTVDNNFKRISYKDVVIENLSKVYSKFSYQMEDIFRKHCWRTYQCGNLHQLQRDGVLMVAWKTGHHVDDCSHCRAFETGDSILHNASGVPLEHHRDVDTVRYYLKDIVALSEFDSPMYFCHDDCRCFFVAA